MLPEFFVYLAGTGVGILYPAYLSYKALKLGATEDIQRLVVYWIVFATFKAAEVVGDTLIFWFPFYYDVKLGLQIWLLFPSMQGSDYVYKEYILPQLTRHEKTIDESFSKARSNLLQSGTEWMQNGAALARRFVAQEIGKVLNGKPRDDISVESVGNETMDLDEYDVVSDGDSVSKKKSHSHSLREAFLGRSRSRSRESSSGVEEVSVAQGWWDWLQGSTKEQEKKARQRKQS